MLTKLTVQLANNGDPDQTLRSVSDMGLYCLQKAQNTFGQIHWTDSF